MSTSSLSTADPTTRPASGKRETERLARRERLLDAAERRFAAAGYEGTALRDVTADAGTRLASVTDEFGGKEQLFREVMLRRAIPLEAHRLQMLDAIPGTLHGAERIGAIVDAFARPMLDRAQADNGWGYYFQFIAQLANSRHAANLLVATDYNRVAQLFVDAFADTVPEASDENAYDAYLFMLSSALEVFANTTRLDSLSNNKYAGAELPRRYAALRTAITAGIAALLNAPAVDRLPAAAPSFTSENFSTTTETIDRYERGLAKLAESLQDLAPAVGGYLNELPCSGSYPGPGLDNQQRAMITLASLVTLGAEAQIEPHLNTALASGLEPGTIVELMMQLIPYTGFPRVLDGLGVAKQVFAQRNITT